MASRRRGAGGVKDPEKKVSQTLLLPAAPRSVEVEVEVDQTLSKGLFFARNTRPTDLKFGRFVDQSMLNLMESNFPPK